MNRDFCILCNKGLKDGEALYTLTFSTVRKLRVPKNELCITMQPNISRYMHTKCIYEDPKLSKTFEDATIKIQKMDKKKHESI